MVRRTHGWKLLLVGSVLAVTSTGLTNTAQAASSRHVSGDVAGRAARLPVVFHGSANTARIATGGDKSSVHSSFKHGFAKGAKGRYASHYEGGGLQCVPYARAVSGIELKGNAANWWYAADGVYDRGNRPEAGSVLNFRATGRMHLGHVAVVTSVMSNREIEVDHANWAGPGAGKGGISRNIPVVDVSAANDWSEVRVGLGQTGAFGSTYPTYGFIYDRPDTRTMVARNHVPHTFNTAYVNSEADGEEVAEAPASRGTPRVHRPAAAHVISTHKAKPHH